MQKLEHWKYFHCVTMSHLAAFDAFCCELLLVALGAVDVVLLRDEALCADGVLAGAADEALLVPLPSLVLHLLHTCRPRMCLMKSTFVTLHLLTGLEDISTSVTSGGELGVIARSTVDSVRLWTKLLVHKTGSALRSCLFKCPLRFPILPCCRGSRPRANASLCMRGLLSRFQWSFHTRRSCWRTHSRNTTKGWKKKSVAFADISIIEPVSLILFSSPWCSRDGHRGGRTWKDIDENTEEKKWYIWYIRVAKVIYLIYRDGRDYVFDIQGWQRLCIWYRRVTKIRAHLCPARLSSQWWQNMASVSWTSSAGDLQVSQDQWQSVCWQELVQGFLSLDFHFYCKINWNIASYFRKVSGVLPVLAKLTPLPSQRILFLRPDLSNFSSLWGSILGSEVYDVFLTAFVDILRRRILLDWPIKHPSDPMFISPPLLLRRCMLPLAIKITGKLNFPRSCPAPALSMGWPRSVESRN